MTILANGHGPNWKGGVAIDGKGYRLIFTPEHPRANSRGYVREHILIAEKALGHALPSGAIVHHFDEVKGQNRNENLVICEDVGYHALIHLRMRIVAIGGDPNKEKICFGCGLQPISAFRKHSKTYDGLFYKCRACHATTENARYHASRKSL